MSSRRYQHPSRSRYDLGESADREHAVVESPFLLDGLFLVVEVLQQLIDVGAVFVDVRLPGAAVAGGVVFDQENAFVQFGEGQGGITVVAAGALIGVLGIPAGPFLQVGIVKLQKYSYNCKTD